MSKTLILVALLMLLAVDAKSVSASRRQKLKQKGKFDWNHATATAIWHVWTADKNQAVVPAPRVATWTGPNPGGHNFATRRALDYALEKAKVDKTEDNLVKVFGYSISDLSAESPQSFTLNALLYGNFQNELRVNLDGDSSAGMGAALAGSAIGWGWGNTNKDKNGKDWYDPEIAVLDSKGVPHSKWYVENNGETGYTSANPIHSMLQDTNDATKNAQKYTQAHSFDLLKAFVLECLEGAVANLRAAYGRFEAARLAKKTVDPKADADYSKALRLIGSVFHTIQDSACGCTDKAKPYTKNVSAGRFGLEIGSGGWLGKSLGPCQNGDGHSVLHRDDTTGQWTVTSLADGVFYGQRHPMHAFLDSLYEPGKVADVKDIVAANGDLKKINNLPGIFESFDPAIAGGKILLDVVNAVLNSKDDAKTVAAKIAADHVFSRYATTLAPAPKM